MMSKQATLINWRISTGQKQKRSRPITNETNSNNTKSKNKKWYDTFVASQFESYEVDYLGVYDIDSQFIIKTSNSKIKTKNHAGIN